MKWYRPSKLVNEEIKEPMQAIGVIAAIALVIATVALFVALGKESHAA